MRIFLFLSIFFLTSCSGPHHNEPPRVLVSLSYYGDFVEEALDHLEISEQEPVIMDSANRQRLIGELENMQAPELEFSSTGTIRIETDFLAALKSGILNPDHEVRDYLLRSELAFPRRSHKGDYLEYHTQITEPIEQLVDGNIVVFIFSVEIISLPTWQQHFTKPPFVCNYSFACAIWENEGWKDWQVQTSPFPPLKKSG